MHQLRSAWEAFVAIVIMAAWVQLPPDFAEKSYDLVELFAGAGRLTRLAKARGWNAVCSDLLYDRGAGSGHNCMDMCGSAGFVWLGLNTDGAN